MATQRILQDNRLVWVAGNIREDEANTQHILKKLRTIVHQIDLFTEIDQCIQFLHKVKNEQTLIISSGSLGPKLLDQVHHLPQVAAVYIFSGNPDRHRSWTSEWSKIKGVYNRTKPICEALRAAVKQTNEDLIPMSFVTQSAASEEGSTDNLNRFEPSFMYTTLFKRILLSMEHTSDEKQAIVKFCRIQYAGQRRRLDMVEEFNRDYRPDTAIWWYTRECFTYQLLNRALRLLECDIIVDMGFFIHDLHRQLEQLHREQFADYHGPPLTLYRGQGLSLDDFTKLKKKQGGLLAFNSFLSTSTVKSVSLDFARRSSLCDSIVGIFFVMTVDPTIHCATFANIKKHSFFKGEGEILFAMHAVFRIDDVLNGEGERVFEVRLTLTGDDDPELSQLTDRIEKDYGGGTGWKRVGRVLLDAGQLRKAEELYLLLLQQTLSEQDQALHYHHLGSVKGDEGDYKEALRYYERAISIWEKIDCTTDLPMPNSYNNIATIYSDMGEYSQALFYYNKCLAIQGEILPPNHPHLATSYNNIGNVYNNMGEYSQALTYLNKAFVIDEQTLPANHPHLATSYNNIGSVYRNIGDYSQALSYYNKSLDILEKTSPANHPSLAISYNNIGMAYDGIGEYSQALTYLNKALVIDEQTLPANHPHLATSYNNIGQVYNNIGDYSQALSYYNKSLAIREKALPADHPSLATSFNNIGLVYRNIGEYSQALSSFNKSLAIYEKSRPANQHQLATSYNNIAGMYDHLGDYSQALFYHNKSLAMKEKTLPANHPSLATSYHNIGGTYYDLEEYTEAKAYFEKALKISKHSLPSGHPTIKSCEEWLELVNENLKK